MTTGIIAYFAVGALVGYVRARLDVAEYRRIGLAIWEFDRVAIAIGFLLTLAFWPIVLVVALLGALLTRSS
jgi:hypothetical protein